MSKSNIADFLVEAIKLAGVKRVYGIARDSLNAITETICRDKTSTGSASATRKWRPSPSAPRPT